MKYKFNYLKIFVIASIIVSCNNNLKNVANNKVNNYQGIDKANWLIGEWQENSKYGIVTENWTILDDTTFYGKRYTLKNSDTDINENLMLQEIDGNLFFISIIEDQNELKPIKFKLTHSTETELIFENPKHEFPQKVTYTKVSDDYIVSEITGEFMDKQGTIKSPMFRKNILK
jgi:hypothetical protein